MCVSVIHTFREGQFSSLVPCPVCFHAEQTQMWSTGRRYRAGLLFLPLQFDLFEGGISVIQDIEMFTNILFLCSLCKAEYSWIHGSVPCSG